jgi:hypothetical protein
MISPEFSKSVFNSEEDNLKIIFWGQGRRIKFSVVSKDSQLSCCWKWDYKLWSNYIPFSRKNKKKKFQYFLGKFWFFFTILKIQITKQATLKSEIVKLSWQNYDFRRYGLPIEPLNSTPFAKNLYFLKKSARHNLRFLMISIVKSINEILFWIK